MSCDDTTTADARCSRYWLLPSRCRLLAHRLFAVYVLNACCVGALPLEAAPPSTADVKSVENALRRAADLYRNRDYSKSQELIRRCQKRMADWSPASDPKINARVQRLRTTLGQAAKAVEEKTARRPKPAAKPTNDVLTESRDKILFSRDIAPLLAARCIACHNDEERSSGLSLASYASLMAGGSTGELIDSGPVESTLLIGKLRGIADGQRMPLDDRPLSASEIALFEAWIRQGLKNDTDDRVAVVELAARQKLKHASAEELNQERQRLAIKNWHLAFPGTEYEQHMTPNFLVLGGSGPQTLADWGSLAEATWKQIQNQLILPDMTGISRARVTLFIVDSTYALNEFSTMVTSRALTRPYDETLWSSRGVDAFVVIRSRSDPKSVVGSLGRGLIGVWLTQAPEIPEWLVTGTANTIRLRLAPGQSHAKRLDTANRQIRSDLADPGDFMSGNTTRDITSAAATSYVQFLMQDRRAFAKLLLDLRTPQTTFDVAFQDYYGRDIESSLNDWWSSLPRSGNRR